MNKLLKLPILILFTAILLCSCELGVEDNALASVTLSLTESKALTAVIDTVTAEYRFTSTPLFTLEGGGEIFGKKSTESSIGANSAADLGYFTPGKWRFHVYAYNITGSLIREGSCDVYLHKTAAGLTNTIPITLHQSVSRKGSIHFSFRTNTVSAAGSSIKVSYDYGGSGVFSTEVTKTPVSFDATKNEASYDFSITNLQAGSYSFRIMLYDNNVVIGGETVSSYILDSGTTRVTGVLYPAEWIDSAFVMRLPDTVYGTIGTSTAGTLNQPKTFQWATETGSVVPTRCIWYLDGVQKASGPLSWTYTPTANGSYLVSCVSYDSTGYEMGFSSCLLTVASPLRERLSWQGHELTAATTVTGAGTARASSIVKLYAEIPGSGTILYCDYPTLTASGGAYVATVSIQGKTVTIKLQGNKMTLTPSAAITGVDFAVEASL